MLRHASLGLVVAVVLLSGCASSDVTREDFSPEQGVSRYAARSLGDEGLHRYLRENMGRDPGTEWDFDALCWAGFYFQPSLELARAQWATARAAERTAAQRPNPTLTLTPGYNFTRDAGLSPWMPAIAADVPITTAGKRGYQEAIASAGSEAARLAVATAVWQLRNDLRRALVDSSVVSRRAGLLRTQADLQKQVLQLLEQRYSAGAAAASDVVTVRTALLRAEAAAADAASQAETARSRVATAIGLPTRALDGITLPVPPVAPALAAAALEQARSQALRTRPDLLASLAKYRAAEAELELELAKRFPDIHLGPSYQWDQGQNKWSLGVTIELPLLNHNEGPIAEAVARRAEAVAQFNIVQNQVVGSIDTAVAAMRAASDQLVRAKQLQEELARQTALTEQRQHLGASDQFEVASAKLDAATAETVVLDGEAALAAASGQLEDALQVPFANFAAAVGKVPAVNHP